MNRYLPLIVLLLLALFLGLGLRKDPSIVPSPLINQPAPSFELPELRDLNKTVSKATSLGAPYLLNVWATWCVNCRYEHPVLMQIANDGRIPIVGLNYKDERPAALQWLTDYGDPYRDIAYDESGRVSIDFGVYGAPETFLIDSQGNVRHKVIGPISVELWQETLIPMLAELQSE